MNKIIRKTLSVFLSILMFASCWSFVTPLDAAAEEQGPGCEHNDYATNEVAATCHSEGYIIYVCRQCEAAVRVKKEDATNNHNWEKISEEKSLSCLAYNIGTYRCINEGCKKVKTEPMKDGDGNIVYGPHDVITIGGKAATCTEDGYTEYTRCLNCGKTTHSQKIPSPGHIDKNQNGNCDVCNYVTNPAIGKCDCFCHSKSAFERFLFDFANFFWKIFKVQKNCGCGVSHW